MLSDNHMFAIIKTGGKQYKVKANDVLNVEKLPSVKGDTVSFDQVLLIADGDTVTVGQPLVAGAIVTAELLDQIKARKVVVQKFKSKTRYRRKHGHRQRLSRVRITEIKS